MAERTERRVTPSAIRRRRRRLVLWSLPVVLLALAASVKLASLSLTAQDAITASETARFDESIEASDALMTLNWFEPWIAYYDRGTASARSQSFNDATDDLSTALELAPPERSCEVRVNLALAWEQLGDIYAEAGYLRGASLIYDTALAVIRGGEQDGCFEGEDQEQTDPQEPEPSETPGDQLEDAEGRVEGKQDGLDAAGQEPDDGTGGGAEDGADGGGSSPEQDLEDRGDQAEQDRRDQEADQRGGGEYAEKPW
jgi:tetratricopeptide (TPR) repeat protein